MRTPSAAHLQRCNETMLALPASIECGLTIVEQGAGRVVTTATVSEAASMGSGQLHGTTLYALFDYTAFLAVVTALSDDESAATHDAHFSLTDVAPRGARLRLEAELDRRGRHIAFLSVRASWVADDGERVIGVARITKTVMPMSQRLRDRSPPGAR